MDASGKFCHPFLSIPFLSSLHILCLCCNFTTSPIGMMSEVEGKRRGCDGYEYRFYERESSGLCKRRGECAERGQEKERV